MKHSLSPIWDIWSAWANISYNEEVDGNLDEILNSQLIGNSQIRRAGKPIFDKWSTNSGLETVLDLVHPTERRFFTYQEIKQIYPGVRDMTRYYGLVAAIPTVWKNFIRNDQLEHVIDIVTKTDKWAKPTRRLYWEIIDKNYKTPDALRIIWNNELKLNINEEGWWDMYPIFLSQVKPVKLRFLHYRFITKSLTTNIKRHKWDKNVPPLCSFCQTSDETLQHLFVECKDIEMIWRHLEKWIKYFLNVEVMFNSELICLNNYLGKRKDLINMIIVIVKQYIYACKCLNEKPTCQGSIEKLWYWYRIDKEIARDRNRLVKFEKKWNNMFM